MPDLSNCTDELLTAGRELLDPRLGIMRGLYASDSSAKLLNIRVDELRKVERFIARVVRALSPAEETEPAQTKGRSNA